MENIKEKVKNIAGWTFLAIIIIAGIWILAGDNISNNVKEADLTADISNKTIEKPSDIREGSQYAPNYVYVKYRDGLVDIANPRFEYLDTSKSSWVRGAWYDDDNQYMIINLSGTNYHYCGIPASIWNSFKLTDSFGSFYNSHIKGRYDCRIYPVPQYEEDKKSGSGSTLPSITIPSSGGGYRSYSRTISDVYLYDSYDCQEGNYCYGEDEYGNEIEVYIYEMDDGYGYGEDEYGNEVEFYYDDY